jgi:hypothetical protein
MRWTAPETQSGAFTFCEDGARLYAEPVKAKSPTAAACPAGMGISGTTHNP